MKKSLLTALLLLFAVALHAAKDSVVLKMNDGTEQKVGYKTDQSQSCDTRYRPNVLRRFYKSASFWPVHFPRLSCR